jgi:hypothetical protein
MMCFGPDRPPLWFFGSEINIKFPVKKSQQNDVEIRLIVQDEQVCPGERYKCIGDLCALWPDCWFLQAFSFFH